MGMTIYLTKDETNLIFEAIDMLKSDYSQNGHPEEKKLDNILSKILITRKPTFQYGGIIKGGLLPDETPIMASTEERGHSRIVLTEEMVKTIQERKK